MTKLPLFLSLHEIGYSKPDAAVSILGWNFLVPRLQEITKRNRKLQQYLESVGNWSVKYLTSQFSNSSKNQIKPGER